MIWFGRDENDRLRILGMPVSSLWEGDLNASLDNFEPENPSLLVPRKLGLGWDFNLAALAVKAGWIRPDDSLPDLAEYVPNWLRRAMKIAPVVGGAALVVGAAKVATMDHVATNWSLTGKPTKWGSGKQAAIMPLLVTGAMAAMPTVAKKLTKAKPAESTEATSLNHQAEVLGIEALSLALLCATAKSAGKNEKRQVASVIAPLLWAAVSGGLQVGIVKVTLCINAETLLENGKRGTCR
ncbi:hypothetical protein BK816_01605 [Boudabousia tangfeifanii]|uniref:DUF5808 domain-containing protein n=1 Tax=Boudabousia tangfeifanii TaxID=1912795 RepID=A0A1D9MIN9_9ACTO|nr:DUF5808 domain-containing protein [Boudabousia tangfeifanii]AOZ72152.1 hypothetical protein BK816_01605 [Boudabousia tangfeifanii]